MVKLGLVIGVSILRPAARPRVKVVLPEPTSPINSKTVAESDDFDRVFAKLAPKSSISCSDLIIIV